ncbi:MAG: phasin family protein [Hyphomicrobiaceae bacterium]
MNQQLMNSASDWVTDTNRLAAPEHVQMAFKAGLEKSQETVGVIKEVIEDATREYGKSLDTVEGHSSSLGEKTLESFASNSEAANKFVTDLAAAKTLPEAAQIQMEFWKTQSMTWQRQAFELSAMWGRLAFYPTLSATHGVAKTVREVVSSK